MASAVALWAGTPSGSDLQRRVEADATRGVPLMAPGDVSTLLSEAIVAARTEDERFFEGPDPL